MSCAGKRLQIARRRRFSPRSFWRRWATLAWASTWPAFEASLSARQLRGLVCALVMMNTVVVLGRPADDAPHFTNIGARARLVRCASRMRGWIALLPGHPVPSLGWDGV